VRNDGFTHYYGAHKKSAVQTSVLQPEKLQVRISGDLQREYHRHKKWFEGKESEFIRLLISKGIEKLNEEEIEDIV
jgi:hypothetical protein